MPTPLPKFAKGKAPTMLETDIANVVRTVVNAVLTAKVSPEGCGKVTVGDEGPMIIDVSGLNDRMKKLENTIKETVKEIINNTLKETITNNTTVKETIQNTVKETIRTELANVKWTVKCNGDDTFTITGSV